MCINGQLDNSDGVFAPYSIADQISLVFDIEIDKDVVRRVLARHYRLAPGPNGPCRDARSANYRRREHCRGLYQLPVAA